ncbi:hypothetical protein I204_07827 [Kwoniella mangroviensis CBS 8886]|nr:hypothetical protein I204_07827 [Kwoniella mangroviensis CBS 8886]
MFRESEDSPEVERQTPNPSNTQSTSTPTIPPMQGYIQPPSGDTNRPFLRMAGQHHLATPIPSPTRSVQREIVSPRPRLPSSISTLLNQPELHPPPLDPATPQRGRESVMVSTTRRSSASPPRQHQRADIPSSVSSRSAYPIQPSIRTQRHSFHLSDIVRPTLPPRQNVQTFPPSRSRPTSPPQIVQEHDSRRYDRSLPHLSETSIGQVLSPLRPHFPRVITDEDRSSYPRPLDRRSNAQEMHRSATYPSQGSPRSVPQPQAPATSRDNAYIEDPQHRLTGQKASDPLSESWKTRGRTPMRDRAGWTQSEIARYQEGYNDAMSVMLSGTGSGGADAGHRINMHDHPQTAYQTPVISGHPHPTADVPPPQPPQVYHHQPRYRNESLRIDPSLQRPTTHRRQSQSSSNIPTPTVSTPLHKIHPPPASDYFGRAFHHSHPGSSDHPPAKRPKRQQISCYPCRQRKLRCDGKTPCAQCSRRHIDGQCRYADRIRRRGRGKKVNEDEQGTGDSEEHDDEGEEINQAESSMMAQRRLGGASLHEEERDEIDGDMSLDSAMESGSRPSGIGSPGRYPSSGPADEGEGGVEGKEY